MNATTLPATPMFAPASHDVLVIETGYPPAGYAASYLLESRGRAAFIETGVNASVPRLLQALELRGLRREDVDWVIVTHVHLDHAGGAGALMAALPNARLGVHPRGARHMIDPGPLMKAVEQVYGAEFTAREYGSLVPVPESRVVALGDGSQVEFGGRRLEFIDTPGHARHHFCVWDEQGSAWFTGDVFGLCLTGFRTAAGHCVLPTTSPTQFEPEALHASIGRLLDRQPRAMFPTHFGEVLQPARLAPFLLAQVDAQVEAARRIGLGPGSEDRLREAFAGIYLDSLHRQGWRGDDATMRAILGGDIQLNVDGVRIWLERQTRA